MGFSTGTSVTGRGRMAVQRWLPGLPRTTGLTGTTGRNGTIRISALGLIGRGLTGLTGRAGLTGTTRITWLTGRAWLRICVGELKCEQLPRVQTRVGCLFTGVRRSSACDIGADTGRGGQHGQYELRGHGTYPFVSSLPLQAEEDGGWTQPLKAKRLSTNSPLGQLTGRTSWRAVAGKNTTVSCWGSMSR